MSDFTPGPWETRRALKPVDGEFDFAVNDGKKDVIAEVFGRVSEVETRPAEANANLIAAAPELYEALRGVLYIINRAGLINLSMGVQLGATSWYVKASDYVRYAEEAVTKAGGKK